jgi:DNA-binding transcriptional LysR family regulator
MQELELADVRLFERAAALGSIARAAAALRISRPVASRQLARLEATLGCRLAERDGRTMVLTSDGQTFLPYAERILAAAADATAALPRGAPQGRLRVSTSATYAVHRLVPVLPLFISQFPNVELAIDLVATPVRLLANEIDVAIRGTSTDGHALDAHPIADEPVVLVAAPAYLARFGTPSSVRDLEGCTFLDFRADDAASDVRLFPAHAAPRGSVAGGWSGSIPPPFAAEEERIRLHAAYRASDPMALVGLVEGGCGIARVPLVNVEASLATRKLVRVLPRFVGEPIPICAFTTSARSQDRTVQAFVKFVTATLGPDSLLGR